MKNFLTKSNNTFLRELSSLIRCDQIILCSDLEKILLKSFFKEILKDKLNNITFFYNIDEQQKINPFEYRKDFIFLGNFQHKPNRDSAAFIVQNIWAKLIRRFDPNNRPKLKIFGVNIDPQIKSLQDLSQNIQVTLIKIR